MNFSTVSPIEDYENDPRICLTSVHLPNEELKLQIKKLLTEPLRKIAPDFYYYTTDSLHMTIKNIRVINNPPHFTEEDVKKAFEFVECRSQKMLSGFSGKACSKRPHSFGAPEKPYLSLIPVAVLIRNIQGTQKFKLR